MTFLQDIRRQLKLYRAIQALSQAEVGNMIGADQGSISMFERGEGNLGVQRIEKLMELLGLRLITNVDETREETTPILRERAAPYEPSREVPIPSPEQMEFALTAARRLGDKKTLEALQDMQMEILGVVEELGSIGESFSNHLKVLEQLKFESEHRTKDAIDY